MSNLDKPVAKRNLRRRATYATILAIILFILGYVIYQSQFLETLYQLTGGEVQKVQKADPYSREQMTEDRAAYKKSATAKPARVPLSAEGYFIPPEESAIPDNEYGASVRRGLAIFTDTGANATAHVGNQLSCTNCHINAGRREDSAPMWSAYGAYPAYRAKIKAISTLEDRIQGCFMYSLNAQNSPSGDAPPMGSDIYRDLITYMAWLSDGAPAGATLRGALYPKIAEPKQGYDIARGKVVYENNCQLCHGAQGEGQHEVGVEQVKFPPLWGPDSYNWGAGMARVDTATGFIKANMPLGKPFSLTDQEAWDVAAFINSHERPKDPRQTTTIEQAYDKFHKGEKSYYGKEVDGQIRGLGTERNK